MGEVSSLKAQVTVSTNDNDVRFYFKFCEIFVIFGQILSILWSNPANFLSLDTANTFSKLQMSNQVDRLGQEATWMSIIPENKTEMEEQFLIAFLFFFLYSSF